MFRLINNSTISKSVITIRQKKIEYLVAFLENSVKLYLKLRMNQSYMPYDFRLLVVRTKSTFLSYTRHTIQVDID